MEKKLKDSSPSKFLKTLKLFRRKLVPVPEAIQILNNGKGKHGFLSYPLQMKLINSVLNANLIPMKREKFITYPVSIGTVNSNFLAQFVKETFSLLLQNGIVQHFLEREENIYTRNVKEPSKPKVFTLKDLAFGFEIWLISCGISTFVFLVEIFVFLVRSSIGIFYFLKRVKFL
jgi:hypothetical protein